MADLTDEQLQEVVKASKAKVAKEAKEAKELKAAKAKEAKALKAAKAKESTASGDSPGAFNPDATEDDAHEVPEDDSEPDDDEVEDMLPEGVKTAEDTAPNDKGPEMATNGKPLIAQTQIQLRSKGHAKLLKPGDPIPKGWMTKEKIGEFIRAKPQIISTKIPKSAQPPSLLG